MTLSDDHTYILDPNSPLEMTRLINQDQMITRGMGGPLVEQSSAMLSSMRHILDLGCGPGGWVLDVAFAHSEIDVAGVDISRIMVDYANARARSQGITNASFGVMDITRKLDFADASFDLVNARYLVAVLHRATWPSFLAECTRVLRPGGILRLTEPVDQGVTTSATYEEGQALGRLMLRKAGYGFSPDGRSFGITPVLPHLLRQAGYQNVQYAAHAIEFSAGTSAWADFYRNNEMLHQTGQVFMAKMGIDAQEQERLERQHQQTIIDMNSEDFCGIWHFTTFWGTKP